MSNLEKQLISRLPFAMNDYEFLSLVGSGSFATVFEVFSIRWRRKFAAKMTRIDESLITEDNQLKDPELAALFGLDHPNIIKFYDYFVYGDCLMLILDFCENGTLQLYLDGKLPLPNQITSYIFSDVVKGLQYCHSRCIAHRDLKPANIFIDIHYRAIIADFGLASFQDVVDNACGSYHYCAPEVFSSKSYDPFSSDIWALGVTFFQILTKHLPYTENQLKNGNLPPPPWIQDADSRLVSLIHSMLQVDPSKRPTIDEICKNPYFANKIASKSQRINRKASFGSGLGMNNISQISDYMYGSSLNQTAASNSAIVTIQERTVPLAVESKTKYVSRQLLQKFNRHPHSQRPEMKSGFTFADDESAL